MFLQSDVLVPLVSSNICCPLHLAKWCKQKACVGAIMWEVWCTHSIFFAINAARERWISFFPVAYSFVHFCVPNPHKSLFSVPACHMILLKCCKQWWKPYWRPIINWGKNVCVEHDVTLPEGRKPVLYVLYCILFAYCSFPLRHALDISGEAEAWRQRGFVLVVPIVHSKQHMTDGKGSQSNTLHIRI